MKKHKTLDIVYKISICLHNANTVKQTYSRYVSIRCSAFI